MYKRRSKNFRRKTWWWFKLITRRNQNMLLLWLDGIMLEGQLHLRNCVNCVCFKSLTFKSVKLFYDLDKTLIGNEFCKCHSGNVMDFPIPRSIWTSRVLSICMEVCVVLFYIECVNRNIILRLINASFISRVVFIYSDM